MFDRRNPLSPAMEKAKKLELKKLSSGPERKIDQVYALALGPEEDPIFVYVGISIDPATRWEQHKRGIANGADLKDAYEYIRYNKLKDTVRMVILDAEGEQTEQDWITTLTEAGYPLQQGTGGVDMKRRKRQTDVNRHLLLGAPEIGQPCPTYFKYLEKAKVRGAEWADSHFKNKPVIR